MALETGIATMGSISNRTLFVACTDTINRNNKTNNVGHEPPYITLFDYFNGTYALRIHKTSTKSILLSANELLNLAQQITNFVQKKGE